MFASITGTSRSNRARKLWPKFEQSLAQARGSTERKLNEAYKQLEAEWKKTPARTRRKEELDARKAEVRREMLEEHFTAAREQWEKMLYDNGRLVLEDWNDMSPQETAAVEKALGAEMDEDVASMVENVPAPAQPPPRALEATVAPSTTMPILPPPTLAPPIMTTTRSANVSGNYMFVNPKDFGADDDTSFEGHQPHNPSTEKLALVKDAPRVSASSSSSRPWDAEPSALVVRNMSEAVKPVHSVTPPEFVNQHTPKPFDFNHARALTARDSEPDPAPPKRPPDIASNSKGKQRIGPSYVGPKLYDSDESSDEEDFEQFKQEVRETKIAEFHKEAMRAGIVLSREVCEARRRKVAGKEEVARRVADHEKRMQELQATKEEERKSIVAAERHKRREEILHRSTRSERSQEVHSVVPQRWQNQYEPEPEYPNYDLAEEDADELRLAMSLVLHEQPGQDERSPTIPGAFSPTGNGGREQFFSNDSDPQFSEAMYESFARSQAALVNASGIPTAVAPSILSPPNSHFMSMSPNAQGTPSWANEGSPMFASSGSSNNSGYLRQTNWAHANAPSPPAKEPTPPIEVPSPPQPPPQNKGGKKQKGKNGKQQGQSHESLAAPTPSTSSKPPTTIPTPPKNVVEPTPESDHFEFAMTGGHPQLTKADIQKAQLNRIQTMGTPSNNQMWTPRAADMRSLPQMMPAPVANTSKAAWRQVAQPTPSNIIEQPVPTNPFWSPPAAQQYGFEQPQNAPPANPQFWSPPQRPTQDSGRTAAAQSSSRPPEHGYWMPESRSPQIEKTTSMPTTSTQSLWEMQRQRRISDPSAGPKAVEQRPPSSILKKAKGKKYGSTKTVTVEVVSDEEEEGGAWDRIETLPSGSKIIMEPRPSVPESMYDNVIRYGEEDEQEEDDDDDYYDMTAPSSFAPTPSTAATSPRDDEAPWGEQYAAWAAATLNGSAQKFEQMLGGHPEIKPAADKRVRWTSSVIGGSTPADTPPLDAARLLARLESMDEGDRYGQVPGGFPQSGTQSMWGSQVQLGRQEVKEKPQSATSGWGAPSQTSQQMEAKQKSKGIPTGWGISNQAGRQVDMAEKPQGVPAGWGAPSKLSREVEVKVKEKPQSVAVPSGWGAPSKSSREVEVKEKPQNVAVSSGWGAPGKPVTTAKASPPSQFVREVEAEPQSMATCGKAPNKQSQPDPKEKPQTAGSAWGASSKPSPQVEAKAKEKEKPKPAEAKGKKGRGNRGVKMA